jgi:hypothetical protein
MYAYNASILIVVYQPPDKNRIPNNYLETQGIYPGH